MRIPNADRAVIEPEKLTNYLLNLNHKRGGTKAKLLMQCGYSQESWQRLKTDICNSHLPAEVDTVRETMYGTRYEISAYLSTPVGRQLLVRTVWQIDRGTNFPRFITLIPD